MLTVEEQVGIVRSLEVLVMSDTRSLLNNLGDALQARWDAVQVNSRPLTIAGVALAGVMVPGRADAVEYPCVNCGCDLAIHLLIIPFGCQWAPLPMINCWTHFGIVCWANNK